MTIGKNSKRSSTRSSIRAPKFLDKSNGFYGRLDEPEAVVGEGGREEARRGGGGVVGERGEDRTRDWRDEAFGEGLMEDDGESLLCRKPSRRSSRWRRSSRRKQKEGAAAAEEDGEAQVERPDLGPRSPDDPRVPEGTAVTVVEAEKEKMERGKEAALVHFPAPEDQDDQVLIRDKKRGREEEGEEEARMRSEQEEGMKVVKRATMKTYRKALDRAFRRGWEAFITNLYSVTLTPVSSSSPSSPSQKKKHQHSAVLAEFQ